MLVRGLVDQQLDGAGDVGATGAAIGRDLRRIAVGDAAVAVERRNAVDATHGDAQAAAAYHRAKGRGVGADVGAVLPAHGEEITFLVQGQFAGQRQCTAVVFGQKQFRTQRHPFHRAIEFFCRQHHGEVFRVDVAAQAEAAADIAGDDTNRRLGQAGDLRDVGAHARHALAWRVHHHRAVFPFGQECARFHRRADDALALKGDLAAQCRARKRRVHRGGIARLIFEGEVTGRLSVQLRRAGACGRLKADGGGQVLVLDHDGFGGILRLRYRISGD